MISKKIILVFSVLIFVSSCKQKSSGENPTDFNIQSNKSQINSSSNNSQEKPVKKKELIEIINANILHDGEFNRYFHLKAKNNSKYDIIGILLHITPSGDSGQNECFIDIQKKVNYKSNEVFEIKEKDTRNKALTCPTDSMSINITNVVLSNGKKLNLVQLWNAEKELFAKD